MIFLIQFRVDMFRILFISVVMRGYKTPKWITTYLYPHFVDVFINNNNNTYYCYFHMSSYFFLICRRLFVCRLNFLGRRVFLFPPEGLRESVSGWITLVFGFTFGFVLTLKCFFIQFIIRIISITIYISGMTNKLFFPGGTTFLLILYITPPEKHYNHQKHIKTNAFVSLLDEQTR